MNPLLVAGTDLVAADALVILAEPGVSPGGAPARAPICDAVFSPSSLAVVGASDDVTKWGGSVLRNLIDGGFEGAIYPINPRGGSILGLPAYASPDDLPETPELVIVALGWRGGRAGRRGVRPPGACPRSSSSPPGSPKPATRAPRCRPELARAAATGDVTLVGPNCMGALCTSARAERRRLRDPASGVRTAQRGLAVRQHRHPVADDRRAPWRRRGEVREQRQPGATDANDFLEYLGADREDRGGRDVRGGRRATAADSTTSRARRRRASRSC